MKNSTFTASIGGCVRILLVPTRCPKGIALFLKKRCQFCVVSRMQRIKFVAKIGGKVLPHLGGNGKMLGDIPLLRHHHDDGPNIDGSGKPAIQCLGQFFCGIILKLILCKIKVIFGNSQQQFFVTDGRCKEFSSNYRKLATEIILRQKLQQ